MSIALGNVHARLEHQHTERDPRDPAHEAYDTEDREEHKDNSGRVVFLDEVEDGRADTKCDIQNASDPNELLCEGARHGEVQP